ncbi:MAG TPA: hypothetical protein VHS78_14755 [Candidatus Elarobacter sp.]|jgi:hypothetical protein|nr:hypothetical protein [Candidatus Elarobacter sp.]
MNTRALAVVASLALLAGCGGGGGSAVAPQQPQTQPTNTPAIPTQSATVTLLVPRTSTSSSARAPQFVSPNAATLTVTVLTVNGSAPTAAQVPPSVNPTVAQLSTGAGGNCTAVTGGLSCTVTVPAPTGAVKYSFQLKDSSSNLLATSTPTFNVATGNQTFATQLNGVVRTVTVTAPALHSGTPFSGPITVAAFDATGAQIVGSAAYANPFTLTDGDATGHTSLTNGATTGTSVTVGSPNDVVILNFDGSNQVQSFQITASGGTQAGTPPVSGGGAVIMATFSASATSTLSFSSSSAQDSTSTTSLTLPSAGGYSGTESFTNPFSPVSATVNDTLTNITPSGVSQSSSRSPQGARIAQTIPPGAFVLLYFQEKFDHTIQFPAAPTFSFKIPSGVVPSGSTFYVGYYDAASGQWNDTFEGPITVSGTTVTFVSNGKPFTFLANVTYTFRLIYFPPGVPTPAPSPSPAAIVLTGTTTDDAAHGGQSSDPNYNQPTLFFVLANQTESFTASQTGTSSFVFGLDPTSCGTGASAIVSFATSDNKTFSVTSSTHDGFCKGFVTGAEGSGATVWFSNTSAAVTNH